MRTRHSMVVTALLATAAAGLAPSSAAAQQGTSTANMQVSANVVRKCWITAIPLAFGDYDPVQVNATAALDAQSTLTVACTKGTSVTIALDNGLNPNGTVRQMSAGGANLLAYEIYQDTGRSQRWGDTGAEVLDAGVAPSKDPREFIVYGRVAAGQDVPEGSFQDTVLVTVQF